MPAPDAVVSRTVVPGTATIVNPSPKPRPPRSALCGFPILTVKLMRISRPAGRIACGFRSWRPWPIVCRGAPAADANPAASALRVARPLYVTLGFFVVALTLVLIGAMRSAEKSNLVPSRDAAGHGPDSPRAVTVIMRDYLFEPNPLALYPGETIRLTAFDAGLEAHELVLGDVATQTAWAAANAAATPPAPFTTAPPASAPAAVTGLRLLVQSGQQVTVDWTVPAVGPLLLQCHLAGHLERGMTANVVVQAASPSSVAALVDLASFHPIPAAAPHPSPGVHLE